MSKFKAFKIIVVYFVVFLYLMANYLIYGQPVQEAVYQDEFKAQRSIIGIALLLYFISIGVTIGYIIRPYIESIKYKRKEERLRMGINPLFLKE
jgi:hypothetical protein